MTAGDSWAEFLWERLPELWLRTGEHLMLTGVSTGLAIEAACLLLWTKLMPQRVARM